MNYRFVLLVATASFALFAQDEDSNHGKTGSSGRTRARTPEIISYKKDDVEVKQPTDPSFEGAVQRILRVVTNYQHKNRKPILPTDLKCVDTGTKQKVSGTQLAGYQNGEQVPIYNLEYTTKIVRANKSVRYDSSTTDHFEAPVTATVQPFRDANRQVRPMDSDITYKAAVAFDERPSDTPHFDSGKLVTKSPHVLLDFADIARFCDTVKSFAPNGIIKEIRGTEAPEDSAARHGNKIFKSLQFIY